MRNLSAIFLSLLLLTGCGPDEADFKSDVPISSSFELELEEEATEELPEKAPVLSFSDEINLDVPFFSQAPDADWGEPWQEACEEASILLAYHYATGQTLTLDAFRQGVLDLVDYQNETFGDYEHTDITQTAQMLEEQLGFSQYQISEDPSIDQMKQWLSQGQVLVVPFAGRQLGNPFYSNEGPYYHMMVIKGYDDRHFITNDVGTRRGHNFIYPYETVMSAFHEWHDEDINKGASKLIVFEAAVSGAVGELDTSLVE